MRKCGECSLCCTLVACPALKKPVNQKCVHCVDGIGCAIHASRPQMCADFECAWLRGDLPEWARPDKVHFVVEVLDGLSAVLVLQEPGQEWCTPEVDAMLKSLYRDEGVAVITNSWKALLPHGMSEKEAVNKVKEYAKQVGIAK